MSDAKHAASKALAQAQKKAQENLEGWQRAKADYANLKKESEQKIQEIGNFANIQLITELLPVFDHLKSAVGYIPKDLKDTEWARGFAHIQKQFEQVLQTIGLKQVETVGKKFDPMQHEAIAHEKKQGFDADTIFEEVKPGYTFNNKLIIAAKVKVAK